MVLVEVLVLEGHVAVVDGDGKLALAEQPLLSQVVVDLVSGLHEMIRFTITIKILGLIDATHSSTKAQHVLEALARIPRPLPTNETRHQRGRVPHQKTGQVSTTNTVLTHSHQCREVHTISASHTSHAVSHASHGHGQHHGVHTTGIRASS